MYLYVEDNMYYFLKILSITNELFNQEICY